MYLSKLKRVISMILVLCIFITSLSIRVNSTGLNHDELHEGVSSPSGIEHINIIRYELEDDIYADYENSYTTEIKFKLDKPAKEEVSFHYKIHSASAIIGEHFSAINEGTIIFDEGETEKSLNIEIPRLVNKPVEIGMISDPNQFWTGGRVFYINCNNIENALFGNDKSSMTIPVHIQNHFNLAQSYENATNIYLVELSKITDVEEFPDTPGKFINRDNTMNIATGSEINGDLRTMIDLGAISHVKLPVGYFLTEIEDPVDPEALEHIFLNISSNINEDLVLNFQKDIEIKKGIRTDFGLGDIEIKELYLGPTMEGNGMVKSISSNFDYSTVTEAVYTYFHDENNNYIEKQMNFIDIMNPYVKEISSPNDQFYYGENIPITIEYNEPVLVDDISIKVNDRILYPIEVKGTISNEVSFLFEIEDSFDEIVVTDVMGAIDLAGNIQDEYNSGFSIPATLSTFDPEKSFVYFANTNINVINNGIELKGEIIIFIKENYDLTNWLGDKTNIDGLIPNIKAKVIGNDGNPIFVDLYTRLIPQGTELRGEFYPPQNTSDENNYYIAEIYFKENIGDEYKLLYPLLKEYTIPPIIYIDEPSVKAILYKPTNFYTTDGYKEIKARFKIDNFNEETQFDLSITKNSEDLPFFTTTNPVDINREISIDINSVDDNRLLDIYTLALKAKNYLDETFSYDSYILYVYNSNALKIMAGNIATDSLRLNIDDKLSTMTSEEILALNRNISLIENISINNKEYKWNNLADKITWEVEDRDKVILKYNDNGIYKEIDNSNIGFIPGMNFVLEGISDGTTSITATHKLTGMSSKLDIEVDKSKDKLYLFQVYPAQKARVYYTNGDNRNKSLTTDERGRIAIYEKNGIMSSISFTPVDTNLYESVEISNNQIKTTQRSLNEFGLYPQTIVNFPPVQYKAAISLYDRENNISYRGDIRIKGGVYRNGIYCPDAKINGISGKIEQTINVNQFDLFDLNFNPAEFINEIYTSPITVFDNIEYVIEVIFPDKSYFPVIIKIDNDTIKVNKFSPYGAIAYKTIEKINLNNFSDNMIFFQTINVNGKVENVDGEINIKEKADTAIFTMEIAIEGDKKKDYHIGLTDERYNLTLIGETTQYSYEFTDTILIKCDFQIEDYIKRLKDLDKVRMYLKLKISDNRSTKELQLSKLIIINTLIDVPNMSGFLEDELNIIAGDFENTIKSPSKLGAGLSNTVKDTLEFLSKYGIKTSSIRLEVHPTDNPLVYKGVIKFAVGDLTRENPTGVFLEDTGKDEKLSFMPGISDLKSIKKGDYLQKSKATMESSKKGHGGFAKTYGGGAYLESEIYYDLKDKEWKMVLLNSDVYIGVGGTYSQVVNGWAGPIPVTAEFVTGLTGQIGRKNIVYDYYWDEEENAYYVKKDYITELRPYFYIYGFGGLGADYKVASLKIGPYGQINLDQQYLWLNGSRGEKNGQKISISGETGIKFTGKVVFVEYSKKIKIAEASKTWKYNKFDEINKLYTSKTGNTMMMRYAEDEENYYYMEIEPEDETFEFEDRSYLENFNRQWHSPMLKRFSMDEDMTTIQTNAYPYSNPVFTDDGMIMAYLSDNDSKNINDTSVYFTEKNGGSYAPGNEVDPSNYADMDLTIDGTKDNAVLAWTRVMDKIEVVGEEASYEDLYNMLGNTEIMVSIYDGENFTTTQLTENHNADMVPVVATNGGKSIVAWRSLESSIENPLEFNSKDNIMYSMFDGDSWSKGKVLYEGTVDKVGTVNVEMLSNGRSVITYEIEIGETGNTEILYATIDEEGNITNNIRLTNNGLKDENPQITHVIFPDDEQRFIIGWNTERVNSDYTENIIKLVAINSNGTLYPEFEIAVENTADLSNLANFKFTKAAERLEDLSIIWNEVHNEQMVYKENIWGRKFVLNEKNIQLGPKMKLLELEDNHTVDFFNGYIHGSEIHFSLLISDNIDIERPEAKMVIAKSKYQNSAILDDVYFSLEDVLPNVEMPVRFTLYNQGIEPINQVSIHIGNGEYTFEDKINPGEYKRIVVLYRVPEVVENPEYKVISKFLTSSDIKEGILKIALPDIEIQDIKTIKEKDRHRVLSLRLNNRSPVDLVPGKHRISIEVYTTHNFDTMPILTETIINSKDLNAINNGVYVKDFRLDEEILELILDNNGEIPTDGHRIFFNVTLYENGKQIDDRDISNNIDYKKIESLITKNNKDISIGSMMESEDNRTTVTVETLNNSMKGINNGNIIVKLKDKSGNTIETKQTYNSLNKNESLVKIEGEETIFTRFNFNKAGVSTEITFEKVDSIHDPDESTIPSIPNIPNIPNKPKDPTKPEDKFKFELIKPYSNNFKDISQKSWFYEAVKFVYERGLMVGTGNDKFSPHAETTRGMLLTVLYRIEGEPSVGESKFKDITKDKYYANAVAWGDGIGIVEGINETEFGPNNTITREQFVSFLYRYVLYKGYTMSKAELSNYEDKTKISDYALEAMKWAVGEGLIKGRSSTQIVPQGNTTRAEMATILQGFIEQVLLKYK